MPSHRGNPNIAEFGTHTRFGARSMDAAAAGRKGKKEFYLIRAELKYLAKQMIDPMDLPTEFRRLEKMGNGMTTPARLIAVGMLKNALTCMNARNLQMLIYYTEGRIENSIACSPCKTLHPEPITLEEATIAYNAFIKS